MKRLKWTEIKKIINDRIKGYNYVLDNYEFYRKNTIPLSKLSIAIRKEELELIKEGFDKITNTR